MCVYSMGMCKSLCAIHMKPHSQAFSLLCAQCVHEHTWIAHGGRRRPGSEAIHTCHTYSYIHMYLKMYMQFMYNIMYMCKSMSLYVYICTFIGVCMFVTYFDSTYL